MATMNASTERAQLDPNTELEELLSKAAGVVETLMHDPTIAHSASNAAWAVLELLNRAQVAHSQLQGSGAAQVG